MDLMVLFGFVVYFVVVLLVGYYFYNKSRGLSDYILGGRELNPYVAALSAQASDMSGWLLLGLPGAIYLYGIGQMWIGVGLAIGSYLAWLLVAKRLRNYTFKTKDSITLSEYFSNRFRDENNYLRTLSAIVILVFFTFYVASGFVACGNVFQSIFPDVSYTVAMLVGVCVVVAYTVLGGFKAICWTDFLQAMLMLVAVVVVPLAAMGQLGGWGNVEMTLNNLGSGFLDPFQSEGLPLGVIAIVSSLAWGLGYFGMPHILVRYMAIEKPRDIKVSRRVATCWIIIALFFAILIGVVGRAYAPNLSNPETVFIVMVAGVFAPLLMGILYSALMAAVMSTADSQLLVASAAVTNDLYRLSKNKEHTQEKLMWVSRIVVIVVAAVAAIMALDKNGGIMDLVSYAWAGFGAAFGPVVLLSLFWKRSNGKGAFAAMLVGFMTIILWNTFLVSGGVIAGGSWCIYNTGVYELLPGFVLAFITMVVVSLLTEEPTKEMYEEFDEVVAETKSDV